jgi:hypothetical protein
MGSCTAAPTRHGCTRVRRKYGHLIGRVTQLGHCGIHCMSGTSAVMVASPSGPRLHSGRCAGQGRPAELLDRMREMQCHPRMWGTARETRTAVRTGQENPHTQREEDIKPTSIFPISCSNEVQLTSAITSSEISKLAYTSWTSSRSSRASSRRRTRTASSRSRGTEMLGTMVTSAES